MPTHIHHPMVRFRRAAAIVGAAAITSTFVVTAPSVAAVTPDETRQIVGPLVTETASFDGAPAFSAPTANGAGRAIPANRAVTLEAARAKAAEWILPAENDVSNVRPVSSPNLCLTAGSSTVTNSSPVTLTECDIEDPAQLFTLDANTPSNNPIGTGLRSTYNNGFLGLYNKDSVMRLQARSVADRIPTLDEFGNGFSATADAVDPLERTAELSGRGTPGSTVLFDGTRPVAVGADGQWHATLTNLPLGVNDIHIEQYSGSARSDEVTLRVTVELQPLTFGFDFAKELDTPVTASGVGHPGAEVRLFGPDGSQVGAVTRADATTGEWETTIPAPDAGGTYAVTAAQFAAGQRDRAHDVTQSVDYGNAVSITSPENGSTHDGGPLHLSGTGEPGATIEIHDVTDGDRLVGTSTDGVLPNDRWDVTTDALDRTEHVLRAVQKSKGANTTVATITINEGRTSQLAPVEVAAPATVTPGVTNVFAGTGEPDATYRVVNAWGTPLIDGTRTVDAQGQWSFERVIGRDATSFTFALEQTKNGVTETSQLFTIDANDGLAAITVDNETISPNAVNTITGKGPAGATFEVLNSSGTVIVPGTHDVDANGTWKFDRFVGAGARSFSFKLRVTAEGLPPYTTGLFTILADTR